MFSSIGQKPKGSIIDLSGLEGEYFLKPGETAKFTFANVLTLSLPIKLAEGVYTLTVLPGFNSTTYTGNFILTPNKGGLTAGVIDYMRIAAIATTNTVQAASSNSTYLNSYGDGTTFTYFYLGAYKLIASTSRITTATCSKSMKVEYLAKSSSTGYNYYYIYNVWDDSTTVWSILGVITFPYAYTGTIYVTREY